MARLPSSLPAEAYEELKAFIASPEADKYGVDREKRIRDLARFDEGLTDAKHYNSKPLPTLYTLPKMLKVGNVPIKDVYEQVWHVEMKWPDKQAEDVAAVMDEFPKTPYTAAFAKQLCELIHSFIEPWWESADPGRGPRINPTNRIKNVYMKHVSLDERAMMPKEVQDTFTKLQRMLFGASHLEIPQLCDVLHISFHWVIGYPPEVLVLGKNQYTERFMDDFLRLPASQRAYFETLVFEAPEFVQKNVMGAFSPASK